MFEVNTVELKECLKRDLMTGLTPMVASSPGIGKSDIIRSVAEAGKLKVIDIRVSQCEPVDMQGFPGVTSDERMTFHIPEYFPIVGDALPSTNNPNNPEEKYKGWVIFLDEFNSGSKQTEAACYKLILDRAVYKYKLHPMCFIIAAGNLSTDRAIVNTQSTATTSRMTHYRVRIDHEVWIEWANSHDIDHRIVSFIKFKPSILHKFDPATNELTFPCPRTWEFASKSIRGSDTIDKINKVRLAGTVGHGAAMEFATYCQIYQNLPTIDQIVANPTSGWTVPKEPSELYAITTMISHNTTVDNIAGMLRAIERLPMDFQVITFKEIYKRIPEPKSNTTIKEWIVKNSSVMF